MAQNSVIELSKEPINTCDRMSESTLYYDDNAFVGTIASYVKDLTVFPQ